MSNVKVGIVKVPKKVNIPAFDEPDLLSEVHKMISGKVSENYDELVFSLLEQFGITKENWRENLDRVKIFQAAWSYIKHFHIDGEYRFSIIEEPGELIFDNEKNTYGMRINYRVEVFEDMLEE